MGAVCPLPAEAARALSSENAGKKLQLATWADPHHFPIEVGAGLGSYSLMHLLTHSSEKNGRQEGILDLPNADKLYLI